MGKPPPLGVAIVSAPAQRRNGLHQQNRQGAVSMGTGSEIPKPCA